MSSHGLSLMCACGERVLVSLLLHIRAQILLDQGPTFMISFNNYFHIGLFSKLVVRASIYSYGMKGETQFSPQLRVDLLSNLTEALTHYP